VQPVLKVFRASRVFKVNKARQVQPDKTGILELQVSPALPVQRVQLDLPGRPAQRVKMEIPERPEKTALPVLLVQQDRLELQVPKAYKVFKAFKV
jgi:hypothetical protein